MGKQPIVHSDMTLGQGLKWVAVDFLPRKRRLQAFGVLLLMLAGGLAELVTLAAVFPLLAFMASPETIANSRAGEMLSSVGFDLTKLSLPLLSGVFCAIAIAAAFVRMALAWASQKFTFRVGYDLGVFLYQRMLLQPYSFHAQMNSARIVATVNNIQRLLTAVLLPLVQSLSSIILGLFMIAGLLIINPAVAGAAMLGFGGIYCALTFAVRGRLRRNADAIHQMRRKRVQVVQEGLGGIRDVLIDNSQPLHVTRFARLDTKLRDAQAANALIGVAPRFFVEAFGMVFIVFLALMLREVNGSLADSLPVLAVLALGAQRLMPLFQQVYSAWANVMGHRAMFLGVVELLRRPIPVRFEVEGESVQLRERIAFEGVSYRYITGDRRVLEDVSLTIPKGSRVGFIGKSGSGKSTLMDLVLGLLEPTQGAITIDGTVLNERNVISWQRQIAHVSQHIFLADASIRENVAFGVAPKDIDEERVRNACRLAELDEFVHALPGGYDEMVGEKGIRLSGGQRQRIGIARALYKQAEVLVLDEATSALDDETEAAVIGAVNRLGREYTVLMIAHRLTTLRGCDRIVRLDHGRVVEQGSYADVIGRGPFDRVAANA